MRYTTKVCKPSSFAFATNNGDQPGGLAVLGPLSDDRLHKAPPSLRWETMRLLPKSILEPYNRSSWHHIASVGVQKLQSYLDCPPDLI